MKQKLTGHLDTTGIGSLPFTDAVRAADFVLTHGPDIPFWPQLPRRNAAEKMIPQYAAHMPCVRWDAEKARFFMDTTDKYGELEEFYGKFLSAEDDAFALPQERAAGFYAFLQAMETINAPATVKGQITGPITLSTGISDADGHTLYSDPELRDSAVKCLIRNATWQVRRLQQSGASDVVIFADEPVLAAYGSSAYVGISEEDVTNMLSQVFDAVSETGAVTGMHVCGNSDWAMAMRSGVEILNFDAYQFGATLSLYADQLRQYIDNGGRIAWGMVPTTDDIENETAESLAGRFNKTLVALEEKGIERKWILKHSLLTPSCGAGGLSEEQTEKVFRLLSDLKSELEKDL